MKKWKSLLSINQREYSILHAWKLELSVQKDDPLPTIQVNMKTDILLPSQHEILSRNVHDKLITTIHDKLKTRFTI